MPARRTRLPRWPPRSPSTPRGRGTRRPGSAASSPRCPARPTPSRRRAPTAPSNLVATAASSASIHLTWSDNSTDENGFAIERAPDAGGRAGTYAQAGTVAAGVAAYSDTGLSASTTYWYRIRAYNGAGSSAYSAAAHATTSGRRAARLREQGLSVGDAGASLRLHAHGHRRDRAVHLLGGELGRLRAAARPDVARRLERRDLERAGRRPGHVWRPAPRGRLGEPHRHGRRLLRHRRKQRLPGVDLPPCLHLPPPHGRGLHGPPRRHLTGGADPRRPSSSPGSGTTGSSCATTAPPAASSARRTPAGTTRTSDA